VFINCDIQFSDRLTPLAIFNYRHAFLPFSSPCVAGFSSGVMQHRLLTPDSGQEVVEVRFVHPSDALAEHHFKKIVLMPPQHYILAYHNPFLFLLSPWMPLAPQGM
jgi:hypothetical protein